MSEKFTGDFEKKQEFPGLDEVWGIFKKITKVTELREKKREMDEEGLLFWEAESNIEGGRVEISYSRRDKPKKPLISVVYYDTSGYPWTGYSTRKLENGTWEGLN